MIISCKDRNKLDNLIVELKENILCLMLINYEILDAKRDERSNDKYETLIALSDRLISCIKNNSDELNELQRHMHKANDMQKNAINK